MTVVLKGKSLCCFGGCENSLVDVCLFDLNAKELCSHELCSPYQLSFCTIQTAAKFGKLGKLA